MPTEISSSRSLRFARLRRLLLALSQHHIARILGLLALIAMAGVLIMDWIVMPLYTRHGDEVEMPNVTTMRYEDAIRPLHEAGLLLIKEEERYSKEYPNGYVIEQNPPPHTRVKPGRRVYVVVSRGEKRVLMPNLIGRSPRDAELILRNHRLELGAIEQDFSSTYLPGEVMRQSVPPNAEVTTNTRVNITISSGGEPSQFIVPALEGRIFNDALKRIKEAGLRVGQITYTIAPDLLPDTVIRQMPSPNSVVEKDSAVDLELSTLPGDNGGQGR
ncbi:MAG: PASTA domain-containing protein [candidate division KSB1 bacterium]